MREENPSEKKRDWPQATERRQQQRRNMKESGERLEGRAPEREVNKRQGERWNEEG